VSRTDYPLVSLTRQVEARMDRKSSRIAEAQGSWKLQDPKARFREVVRLAAESGPQHITVNGVEKAVILSTE